jgi:hypothetical protein
VALSAKVKFLLKQLLMVQPTKRFSIEEVVKHDWVKDEFAQIKQNTIEASTFLKNIGTQPTLKQQQSAEEIIVSQEIVIDQIPAQTNIPLVVANHITFIRNNLEDCIQYV